MYFLFYKYEKHFAVFGDGSCMEFVWGSLAVALLERLARHIPNAPVAPWCQPSPSSLYLLCLSLSLFQIGAGRGGSIFGARPHVQLMGFCEVTEVLQNGVHQFFLP